MPQSFLDGMVNQTFYIQDRTLNLGLLKSLSESFKYFSNIVSRLILDKNGLSDQDFSKILEPLSQFKRFRSIIYRRNELGMESLQHFVPMLKRRVPFHLEELTIERCTMTQSVSEEFVDILESNKIFLKKLTLIKMDMTDDVFFKLARHIKRSTSFLREVNLSDNSLRPFCFQKMLAALSRNQNLKHIDISQNTLLSASPENEPGSPSEKPNWNESEKALHSEILQINYSLQERPDIPQE